MVDRIAKTQGKPVDRSAHLQGCALVLWITALLAGCATTSPAPTVQRVEIPVERQCLPDDLPERPTTHTAAELRAMSAADYVLAVSADRLVLLAYAIEAEAVITGCR